MRLKYIELYGFKSFAEKSRLTFEKDISAIVGPNGSGKSNIADAVRWALGEQSAKSLRGSKMEDVIFSGTDTKKQMNMASVSINIDNKDKQIPIAFDEINVTRKVFRTGESEYLLNNSRVRLKDIKELFMDTGIGKDGYSIIGQGRIDDILSGRNEDRRYIFEEACGISKFKYKKNESEKKLEKTQEKIKELKSKLDVKQKEVDMLEVQAKNAKEGMRLSALLERLEISMLKTKLDRLKDQDEKFSAEADFIRAGLQDKKKLNKSLKDKISPTKDEIEKLERRLDKARSKKFSSEKSQDKLSSDIDILKQRIEFLENDRDRLGDELALNQSKKEKNLEEIDQKKKEAGQIKDELKSLETSLEDRRKLLDKLKEDKIVLQEEISYSQSDLDDKLGYLSQSNIDRSTKENLDKSNLEKKGQLEASIKAIEKACQDLKEKMERLDEESKEIDLKIQENTSKINDLLEKRQEANEKLKGYDDLIAARKNFFYQKKSQRDVLESIYKSYEGYYKPVQRLLKAGDRDPDIGSRIVGVLADLIEVDEKYKLALDVSLGSALQNIVVENEEDGKFLISYIKNKNFGRISFLPISRIRGSSIRISHPKVIDSLNNLIEYDPRIEGIVNHYLARTALVENLDDAIEVSRTLKGIRIVTLDGDIINSWGSMVGGNLYRKETNSLLNRKKKLKDLALSLKKAKKDLDELYSARKLLAGRLEDFIYQLNKLDDSNKDLLSKKSYIKQDIKEQEIKLDFNREKSLEIKDEISLMDQALVEKDYSYIEDLEEEIQALREDLSKKTGQLEAIDQEIIDNDKSNIKLESEIEARKRDLAILETDIDNLLIDNENIASSSDFKEKSLDEIIGQVEKSRKHISDLEDRISKSQDFTLENNRLIQDLEKKIKELKQRIESESFRINKLSEEIVDLEKKAFENKLKLENIKDKAEELMTGYQDDYSLDRNDLVHKFETSDFIESSRKEVIKVKNKLSKIGYFNYKSIEDYDQKKEELDFIKGQYEDLIKTREDIIKMIKKLEKEMVEVFTKSFKMINEKFDEVFKILFQGGQAQLILDSDDVLTAGVEIIAKPPGKKLKNIGLLSGGEKSLTAVALLFAIFEINPAPFCILDEIDAALDESNIKRYIDYLKSLTDKTQFIIITHRKVTMEMADILYGVTMEEKGISKVVTLELDDYKEA